MNLSAANLHFSPFHSFCCFVIFESPLAHDSSANENGKSQSRRVFVVPFGLQINTVYCYKHNKLCLTIVEK